MKQTTARARMFLAARLGWIHGFPVCRDQDQEPVQWQRISSGRHQEFQQLQITREHLRDATFGWSKLVRRFPRALPRAVEDYEAWVTGVPLILDRIKQAVHHGEPLPQDMLTMDDRYSSQVIEQSRALSARYPALQPLLDALSWTCFLDPTQLSMLARWVSEYELPLKQIVQNCPGSRGIVFVLRIAELVRLESADRVSGLLMVLGEPGVFQLSAGQAEPYLNTLLQQLAASQKDWPPAPIPVRPTISLGHQVLELFSWLGTVNSAVRRRALPLAEAMLKADPRTRCQKWRDDLEDIERQYRKLSAQPAGREAARKCRGLQHRLADVRKQAESMSSTAQMCRRVRQLAQGTDDRTSDCLASILQRIPSDARMPFLDTVCPRLMSPRWDRDATRVVRELAHRVTNTNASLVAFWINGIKDGGWYQLTNRPFQDLSLIMDAIELCWQEHGEWLSAQHLREIIVLTAGTRCAHTACQYFRLLRNVSEEAGWFCEDNVRLAHQVLTDAVRFPQLMTILEGIDDYGDRLPETIAKLDRCFTQSGWYGLTESALLRDARWLTTLATQYSSVSSLSTKIHIPECPDAPDVPSWAKRFPVELHHDLAVLATVSASAPKIANRVLKKNFPDPDALRVERDALDARLAENPNLVHLAARRRQLDLWLTRPPVVSERRIETLKQKLDCQTKSALLDMVQTQITDLARQSARSALNTADLPDELRKPETMNLLMHVLNLSKDARTLGCRLLRSRWGLECWDPAKEPANQKFLRHLSDHGIRPEPWLSVQPPQPVTATNGQSVLVGLENDPVEVLKMGGYFKTCLSPGKFNFFSAISNAVDINKRVLYARDHQDKVIGRCLLAICDGHTLLTFHAYAHDPTLKFGRIVADFAERLAEQMGTVVAPKGQVRNLIATDWYDDGPEDPGGRFAFLQYGSDFVQALGKMDPDEFFVAVEEQLAPVRLDAATLPLVVELPALDKRPELIMPLLPLIDQNRPMPTETLMRAGLLAHAAGATEFSHRTLLSLGRRALSRARPRHVPSGLVTALVEINPTLGLRLVRRTRAHGVSTDEQETAPRRELLATAHERLGRHALAARLRA